mmetsp:Transcript_50563/g.116691  ORF Transcript_50563/g.116691 Transcript_50563/m.116691 type:complete len:81 (-) Transcript_50563:96-338(-)|eukprot:CAMPEP_0119396184 /NCGR_PEP_ID=MMETSP1334-20130426/135954_1 /TAXON_ID=127549 /ORGANISM="Calcidiscus leptoporus, Strain RCC1130" /LENGTH=80 /DNA_ID=CAMNT_0007419805 /DNA_START=751 /DNA_END=993 /DNA_ORIENTATION=-
MQSEATRQPQLGVLVVGQAVLVTDAAERTTSGGEVGSSAADGRAARAAMHAAAAVRSADNSRTDAVARQLEASIEACGDD